MLIAQYKEMLIQRMRSAHSYKVYWTAGQVEAETASIAGPARKVRYFIPGVISRVQDKMLMVLTGSTCPELESTRFS